MSQTTEQIAQARKARIEWLRDLGMHIHLVHHADSLQFTSDKRRQPIDMIGSHV